MGHLFPQLPRSPAHRVLHCVVFGHMEPAAVAALGAEQFFEPLVAQHQHRVGIDDQLRFSGIHASLLQLLRLQQMQVILLAVALDPLVRVSRAEQLTFFGSAVPSGRLRCSHADTDPISTLCQQQLSSGLAIP